MKQRVVIDGNNLQLQDLYRVSRLGATVAVSREARKRIRACSTAVEKLIARGERIDGVTTGIGDHATINIDKDLAAELQKRLVQSHSVGTGDVQPPDVVRAAMLCRANTIAKGHSAVRFEILKSYIELLNRGVVPLVFEKGSVGASGDLAPMAQIAEVLLGQGMAFLGGRLTPGALALKKVGLEPVSLHFKEGLGLINGCQMITGELALLCCDADNTLKNAIIASAMTVDALRGEHKAFDERLHLLRPYPGQIAVAANIRRLTEGSTMMKASYDRASDGYSIRCIPQVLGPTLDALAYGKRQIVIEMNSAADNPLFFTDDAAHLAGGNFHGQPIAMAADFLAIAFAEVASLSERHINRLMNAGLSGLPQFLAQTEGLDSGYAACQHLAASLVSENKVLAHPAVVDSISLSADQEDHVSMGPVSVRKLKEISDNVQTVVAAEMLVAAQAFELRKPKRPGKGTRAAYRHLRRAVPRLIEDRSPGPDLRTILELVKKGSIVKAAERATGDIDLGTFPY